MNITKSMSRKVNCLDDSLIENFFGILKQKLRYGNEFNIYQYLSEEDIKPEKNFFEKVKDWFEG